MAGEAIDRPLTDEEAAQLAALTPERRRDLELQIKILLIQRGVFPGNAQTIARLQAAIDGTRFQRKAPGRPPLERESLFDSVLEEQDGRAIARAELLWRPPAFAEDADGP